MKAAKLFPILMILVLALSGCGGGSQESGGSVTIGGVDYEKTADHLDLSGGAVPELELLLEFSQLQQLDLRDTGLTAGEYDALCRALPGCRVLWDIPFQGERYPMDTRELTVTALPETDLDSLAYFTELTTVDAEGCADYESIRRLRERRPELEVRYLVSLGGEPYPWDTEEVTLAGADAGELMERLRDLPKLKRVELIQPLPAGEALVALREAYPAVEFYWALDFKGIPVDAQTEALDLTGMEVTTQEVEALIPYLPSLTYVDMTDCGISNEEMDALNRRHESVKIAWTVDLGWGHRVRTDVTYYMPVKENYWPNGNQLDNLKYCTDVVALDVGHMKIRDCEFVAYMPRLKYLIIAMTNIRDLTPLTGLTELVYLEMFEMKVEDLSPLLTLTALEDLNLCYTRGDPGIIAQMTWLKNLWWCDWPGGGNTKEDLQMLRDALPDCRFYFKQDSSTGGGWRELPNYYAQRDAFDMPYFTG